MTPNFTKFHDRKVASYQIKGNGTPLVLLHGFCEDSRIWQDWLNYFSEQSIICIDLPGFGQSDVSADNSTTNMAFSVQAVLEDYGVEQCVLLGHSMGGYVALEFAKQFPKYLRGLGLFHSHPYADTEEKKRGRQEGIDFIRTYGHIYFVKQLFPNLFPPLFARSNQMEMDKLIFRATQFDPAGIIGGLECMRDRQDHSDTLANITCPVLCILGALDQVVPPQHFDQIVLSDIMDVHILPKVGHMGMFEKPKKTRKIVHNFLEFVGL